MVTDDGMTIEDVLNRLQQRIDELPTELAQRRIFAAAYRRTTQDIASWIDEARFEDLGWVELLTVRFATAYLAVHDADRAGRSAEVPRPWQLVFAAPAVLPPTQHLVLAASAHLNFDLPVTLQALVTNEEFSVTELLASRRRDFQRIETLLSNRLATEAAAFGPGFARQLALSSIHWLTGKRPFRDVGMAVWQNMQQLQFARTLGDVAYRQQVAELEVISAARITELLSAPQTAIRTAATDFAVHLPAAGRWTATLPRQRGFDDGQSSTGSLDRRVTPVQVRMLGGRSVTR